MDTTPPPPPGSGSGPNDQPQPPSGAQPQGRPAAHGGAPSPVTRHLVHVTARPGGLRMAFGFVIGLLLLGFLFLLGVGVGLAGALGTQFEQYVVPKGYRDAGSRQVAIVPVTGVIGDDLAQFVRRASDYALEHGYEAVVLRVDSPGGGVAPSDQIWYQVDRLKQAGVPVVASYGGMSTSGGYFVSCAADTIVMEETGITGSIGVIMQSFRVEQMMDKVGIDPVTIVATNSPQKDLGNPFQKWTERDRERFLTILDEAHDTFKQRVINGRSHVVNNADDLRELCDGSIFTARQAAANGLIDSIGYLDDAIAEAEQQAGIPTGRATVDVLTPPTPLFGFGSLDVMGSGSDKPATLSNWSDLRDGVTELTSPRAMYLMP